MKILVISDNYPSSRFPNTGVFLYHLVQEMCVAGHEVNVISPQIMAPRKLVKGDYNYGEELAKVYRPNVISFSAKNIGPFNTYQLAAWQQKYWVRKIVKDNSIEFDLIYTQFISNGLIAAISFPKFQNIFVDAGEYFNIDKVVNWYGKSKYMQLLKRINAFIAVSPFVKEKLLEKGIASSKITVEGNGVNYRRFYPRDKSEMRKKLGLPSEAFIASFTGHFIPTKGPLKLLEAAKHDGSTHLVFMGNGSQSEQLDSNITLFKGVVPNNQVPEYLSASDVFVLPTHHEGSNNSILEAMACGLPIISSDIPEIRLQTRKDNSILVDSMSATEIGLALTELRTNDAKRKSFADKSLQIAQDNSVKNRHDRIFNFISIHLKK